MQLWFLNFFDRLMCVRQRREEKGVLNIKRKVAKVVPRS
jgi:hypothetical protein